MHGLIVDSVKFMTGAATILMNIFKARSAVSSLAMAQTQGQTCVR